MSKRLWEKGSSIDERVIAFTVGNDFEIDRALLPWDCIGSAAHARMLGEVGLLKPDETKLIVAELARIYALAEKGEIAIAPEHEDCHTTIETILTERLGDVGARIHTGRSRNDQVLLALRLLMRGELMVALRALSAVKNALSARFDSDEQLPLPGYTHLMPAMPSSVGMWIHSFFEGTLTLARDGLALLHANNSNPLGAGAGFDSPLPLDRERVAELLAMDCIDRSPIDAQNSRGRIERKLLFWMSEVGTLLEKLAWDLQLFHTREFGFARLPDALTTGSSIMPQKRNPDVLELMRGRAGRIRGCFDEVRWISAKLPSNYHRDFQLMKEPLLRGIATTRELLEITPLVLEGLDWQEAALKAAMRDELYATYDAFARVKQGTPFRTAYRESAQAFAAGTLDLTRSRADFEEIARRCRGSMLAARAEWTLLDAELGGFETRLEVAQKSLFV